MRRVLIFATVVAACLLVIGGGVFLAAYNSSGAVQIGVAPSPTPTRLLRLIPTTTPTQTPDATPTVAPPTPAPIPSPIVGLMPGEGVQLAHFKVTLTGAALVMIPPGPGAYYLEVSWTLENTTGIPRTLYPANYFLKDSNGTVYQPAAGSTPPLPLPPYGTVGPGRTTRGTIAYTVPIAHAMNYIAIFQYTSGIPQAEWTFSVAGIS